MITWLLETQKLKLVVPEPSHGELRGIGLA